MTRLFSQIHTIGQAGMAYFWFTRGSYHYGSWTKSGLWDSIWVDKTKPFKSGFVFLACCWWSASTWKCDISEQPITCHETCKTVIHFSRESQLSLINAFTEQQVNILLYHLNM